MGAEIGAVVDLETVPLKYAGLRYDEIWISEAQERMVLAVPPRNRDQFMEIMQEEEVEATVIGTFGGDDASAPRLLLRYAGTVVGDLDMSFVHDGLPQREQVAEWWPGEGQARRHEGTEARRELGSSEVLDRLTTLLRSPNIASKEWVIRQYDHEVQGGSVVKPLGGPGNGPGDAAVLRPRLDSRRGIAIGCGNAWHLSDVDPYWTAVASIDEAIRNVVCVGGDPARTAILDNFCWGRCDEPRQLGTLVRACQGCYDAGKEYGVPFISGKDSLNNEFALHGGDVEPLLEVMKQYAERESRESPGAPRVFEVTAERVRQTNRLSIPGTLLISALALIDDVGGCVTSDLKQAGNRLYLIGGLPRIGYSLSEAAGVHIAVADAIRQGLIAACHDVSDGGWLVAVAEMAIAGDHGADLHGKDGCHLTPFAECCAGYVVETTDPAGLQAALAAPAVRCEQIGVVRGDRRFTWADRAVELAELRSAWSS
jgi:phosphoribosylformylglycinamidine synthase